MRRSKSQDELDINEGLNCFFCFQIEKMYIEFIEESTIDYDDQEQVTAV
jgi:hypothetical protein